MADYRIFCFGDSITLGALDSEGGWADRLKRDLARVELAKTGADRYQVYNLGVGGDTSESLVKRIVPEANARNSEDWLDVYIVAIGMNDSRFNHELKRIEVPLEEYQRNLLEIAAALKKISNKILFVGLTPVADNQIQFKGLTYKNADIKKYDEVLSKVALELKIPKAEIFNQAKNDKSFVASLRLDYLHPDSTGHKWLYEQIKLRLLELLAQ